VHLSLSAATIWKACFEFQRNGVKGAINKILTHNDCILADSVGLGKTFEALSDLFNTPNKFRNDSKYMPGQNGDLTYGSGFSRQSMA
jgi:hypothetical protein